MKTKITRSLFTFIALTTYSNAKLQAQAAEAIVTRNQPKDTISYPISLNFISTNMSKRQTHYIVNDFAINILSGYANEIRIGEIGGLFNRVYGKVKYLQLAGLGNSVSDTVKGIQIAGIFNANGKSTTGMQIAGIVNHSLSLKGLQIGGLFNSIKKTSAGIQIGGIANYADTLKGLQIGGLVNTSPKINGTQIAGILNHSDSVKGFQLAGIINNSTYTSGCQIAGIINHTKQLDGFQLSLLNFADTCTGIPLGLFSYVKKGYHKIEFTVDELLLPTIGFRIGIAKLHNIFFTGIDLGEKPSLWTYGYGLGSSTAIKDNLNFTCDITSQQIQATNNNKNIRLNLVNKLFLGVDYKAFEKLSIGIGPTYNIIVSDINSKDYQTSYSKIVPYSFYSTTNDDFNIKMWIGAKLSVKFL